MYLMTRLRDEAHRFAITYHRGKRGKAQFKSILSDIPGVGLAGSALLLRHFGSLKRLRNADCDEITEVKGVSERLAHAIYRALHSEAGLCKRGMTGKIEGSVKSPVRRDDRCL